MSTPIEKLAIQNLNAENGELALAALRQYKQMFIELEKYKHISDDKTPEELEELFKELKSKMKELENEMMK